MSLEYDKLSTCTQSKKKQKNNNKNPLTHHMVISFPDSSSSGAPSPSSADASRSPPARSMLRKSSTPRNSQPEVSALSPAWMREQRAWMRGAVFILYEEAAEPELMHPPAQRGEVQGDREMFKDVFIGSKKT